MYARADVHDSDRPRPDIGHVVTVNQEVEVDALKTLPVKPPWAWTQNFNHRTARHRIKVAGPARM